MIIFLGLVLIILGYGCIDYANKLPLSPNLDKGSGSFGIGLLLLVIGFFIFLKTFFTPFFIK
jgi:hypothetical protein